MRPPRWCAAAAGSAPAASVAARTMTARALWMCAVMTARAQVGVAGPDGGDDLDVVGEAAAQRRLVVGVEVAQHDRRVDRAGQRGGQRRVVGEGDQPVVEGAVERDERVEVLAGAGAADVEHPVREVVELRRRRPRSPCGTA